MSKISNVLIIDDDNVHNYLFKHLILEMNVTDKVICQENGLAAIEYLKSNPDIFPEIIIIDHKMPIMDGEEFLQEYLKLEVTNKKAVTIAFTSISLISPQVKENVKRIVDDVILKPFNDSKMQSLVEKHLQKMNAIKV